MLLRATDLVVRHHPSLPPAVDRVSLELAAGELVAVVGSNGSGKSTLARALARLLELESGTVAGARGTWPRVGLVLQDPAAQLITVTAADEVALGPQAGGIAPGDVAARAVHGLEAAGLLQRAADDPASLSGGQQQRLAIAAVLATDVDVLVLDEPTAMLDEPARAAVRQRIAEAGRDRAVLWVTQEPEDLAGCDRVIVLDAGVVAWAGSTDDYLADPGIGATFGLEQPAAARIAHALVDRGAWPGGVMPRALDQLELALRGASGG